MSRPANCSYIGSRLARDHLIVAFAAILWLAASCWQLWVFGNRPELIIAAVVMGFSGACIGFYLATVNRTDVDLQVRTRAIDDEGERYGSGQPLDPQLDRVAAIIAGDEKWLKTSQAEREKCYQRAEAVISAVRQVTRDDAADK